MRKSGATWMLAVGLAGLLFAGVAPATPPMSRVGRAPALASGARVDGALAQGTMIPVTVALAPPDPAALASYATAVSTPGSSDYHRYLSVAAFRQRFAPSDAQIAAVRSTLSADGLNPSPVSANGLSITLSASASQLAQAFSTSFDQVTVPGGRTAYANTSAPALPSSVAATIQSVVGLDDLVVAQPAGQAPATPLPRAATASHAATASPNVVTGGPQPCAAATAAAPGNSALTFDQLASAYDFSGLYQQGDEGAGITIGLYEESPYEASDIAAFQTCYGTDASVSNVVVGAGVGTGATDEPTGDIEDVIALAPKASIVVYEATYANDAESVDLYTRMVSDNVADVISSSWDFVCGVPTDVAAPETTDFEEAAVQGQTVLTAAGDDGSEGCNNFSSVDDKPGLDDPSGEPFITSVGGTGFTTLGPPAAETTWNEGGLATGGGVSQVATMPAYQLDASPSLHVINPAYSSGIPCGAPAGEYCLQTPDVSADASGATGYEFYVGGSWIGQRGTSYAAPLWAALTALTDAAPACSAYAGFLNPLLYQLAGSSSYSSYFHDITTGNSDVNNQDGGLYPAGVGYDMATGLGTPIGTPLAEALCTTKEAGVTVTNPGEQSGTVGTAVTLPITATDINDTGGINYRATGLPPGLTIDPATGVITGTPTAGGASTVTVVATDIDFGAGQAVFGWNVARLTSAVATTVDDAATGAAWAGSERAGAAADAAATVTGPAAGPVPTGSLTYDLFANAGCAAPAGTTQTVTLGSAGAVPRSAASSALAAGSYSYQAQYSGDAAYAAATSPCETFAVAPAATTVTMPPPPAPTCPAATGGVSGTSLGPVKLGMSPSQIQHAHPQTYTASGKYGGYLCLKPTGITLVYAPAKLIASLKAATRKSYQGRLVFAATANAHYVVSGIHVGSTLKAARKALHGGNPLTVGGASWYVALHGSVAVVLALRHGSVAQLGIAVRALNQTRVEQLRFLRDV